MVQRVAGPQIKAPGRREIIQSRFLQELAAGISRNARAISRDDPQYPQEQDGDGTVPAVVLTETPGTRVFGSTVRIEQDDDPTIYIDIQSVTQLTLTDADGNAYELNLQDLVQP